MTPERALAALLPGIEVQWLAETDSTNTRLLERARSQRSPCLLVADRQTAGRGRMGRAWQTEPGASLSFSLGLALAPQRWEGLSLAVGLALADALDPPGAANTDLPPAIGLKWPNDLWRWDGPGRGRKLGGVLIETTGSADARPAARYCVIGVGLNVAPLAGPSTSAGAPAVACLQELQPHWTPADALMCVAAPLLQALQRFESEGFAPFVSGYARRDLLRGQPVHTSAQADYAGGAGIAEGVDADGALCLRTEGTTLQRVVSGEVSVRFTHTPLPTVAPC